MIKKCLMIVIIFLFIPVEIVANDNISATNNTNNNTNNYTDDINGSISTTNDTSIINNVNILIGTEYLEYDKASGADRIKITITTDRPGTFKYIENYYMKNISGQPKFYANQEYYKGNLTDTISFNISRPTRMGEPYPFIKAIVVFNNKVVLKKKIDTYTSTEIRSEKKEYAKNASGYENILFIGAISSIYLIRKIIDKKHKKNKKN